MIGRGATAWPLMAPVARVVSPRLVIALPIYVVGWWVCERVGWVSI